MVYKLALEKTANNKVPSIKAAMPLFIILLKWTDKPIAVMAIKINKELVSVSILIIGSGIKPIMLMNPDIINSKTYVGNFIFLVLEFLLKIKPNNIVTGTIINTLAILTKVPNSPETSPRANAAANELATL